MPTLKLRINHYQIVPRWGFSDLLRSTRPHRLVIDRRIMAASCSHALGRCCVAQVRSMLYRKGSNGKTSEHIYVYIEQHRLYCARRLRTLFAYMCSDFKKLLCSYAAASEKYGFVRHRWGLPGWREGYSKVTANPLNRFKPWIQVMQKEL